MDDRTLKKRYESHDVDNNVQPKSKVTKKKSSTIIKEGQKARSNKKHHYVDNRAFFLAICDYQDRYHEAVAEGKAIPQISNYIGECFLKIAKKLAKHPSFYDYTFNDTMIDNAVEACLLGVMKFGREFSENPFSFYTQTCYYSFLNTMKEESNEIYVKYRGILDSIAANEGADYVDDEFNTYVTDVSIDISHIEKYVKSFEERVERTREKNRQRKEKESTLDTFFE